MKRFILPLLLLLTVGLLIAAQSQPSDVVGYVKYDVVEGNTLIALPMESSYSMASEVGDALGITTVSYWDQDQQLFVNAEYFEWLGGWDNDFTVSTGSVIMVNSNTVQSFYSIGALPAVPSSYNIVQGNNAIMVPLNRSDMDFASVVGDNIGVTTVSYFDTDQQLFVNAEYFEWLGGWDNDFATSIGSTLFVNSENTTVFPSVTSRNNSSKNLKSK